MGEKTIEKNAITEGVIWKQLLIFFFPIMLGTLIQQLYTTVDTIIVGRFVGKAALASVGGPAAVLSTIVVTFFNGLANGAAVIIAQYYGAKDRKSLHVGLHTAYLFSIVISLIVSLVGTVLTPWLLTIMNTPQDMMADSTIYLRIYFMGILFTLVYNMGAAIMRAVGDSRRPLLYLLVCCVMNIILDIVMVVGMKMGIAGAALATVISQCVSAILVTWSLTRAYDAMKLKFRELRMDARVLKKELKIGVPGALQACAYGVTNVVIQASVNSFGTDTAAGWAAYGKLDLIFWTVSSALGAAVTTFAGQNYGAGKMDRVYKSIRVNVVISYIFTGAIIVILFVLGMCSENLRTDSSFEYTNTGQQEIIGISDSKLSQYDICTDNLLRISEKDNEIIQGIIQSIRLKARQNYRLRLLASIRNDFVQSHVYITESVLIKLLSGIIFSSITVVSYIHAKDGEK